MNRKSNTPESFSTESNQLSVKRIAMVTHLKLGTLLGSPARSFQTQGENCEPMEQHRLNWPHCRHTEHRVRRLRMIIGSNWLLGEATQASTGTLLTNLFSTDTISFSSVNLYSLIIDHVVCISENLFLLNLPLLVPPWSSLGCRTGSSTGHCPPQSSGRAMPWEANSHLVCCLSPSQPPLFKHWSKNPWPTFEWGQH